MSKNTMNFYLFKAPFRVSIKTPLIEMEEREVLIVEWVDSNGQKYYGECNAFSTDWYHFETIDSVKKELTNWFERHVYDQIDSYKLSCQLIDELNDFPNARSVMSMIFYQKFHDLYEFDVAYGATVNHDIEKYFNQYDGELPSRIKIKWHNGIRNDIAFLEKYYPQIKRAIDANGVLEESNISLLNTFKNQDFIYIEQPFNHFDLYKEYRKSLMLPIFIDESALNLEQIIKFNKSELIDGVVIKPSRIGGIDKSLEIIDYCKKNKLKFVIGGMYEFGLSSYFTAYLAQHSDYPSDVTPSDYYFMDDIVKDSAEIKNNKIKYIPPKVDTDKLIK